MKKLRILLIATLASALQIAQAVPVNETNLDDFRAYGMSSCKKNFVRAPGEELVCSCTDEKVVAAFRAADWETGAMTSANDKAQFTALHKTAMTQCRYKYETASYAKEQADLCKANIERLPPFAKLDAPGRANACECLGRKISEQAYGTDDKNFAFNKNLDYAAFMPAALASCAAGK
ncbi:hypothetical protein [Pseudoduganella violaceinigra]|uniref:hypothetical protein n=1 Tax=Pseudoduganella violaceinigra TaxID=246602 RepID=UPI0004108400|nr:hypothetical protein [Pseudoduganella violaceinigra]